MRHHFRLDISEHDWETTDWEPPHSFIIAQRISRNAYVSQTDGERDDGFRLGGSQRDRKREVLGFRPDLGLPVVLERDSVIATRTESRVVLSDPKAGDPVNQRPERRGISRQPAPDLAMDSAEAIWRLQASRARGIGFEEEETRCQAGCDVLQGIQSVDRRAVAFTDGFFQPLHLAPIVEADIFTDDWDIKAAVAASVICCLALEFVP